ncbi:hypothetical protein GCM10011491_12240 [Brucella endophytica]|uniref:Thioredoxin-like fold domain-containing protein n=1 Tax=Brucella endophytica TaxID=1963359 RepID=A0A916WCR3_9HYPH|nr:thioredoxin domain-containing protein [Brucella endophytica]GGA86188.1 hypothetical protein GCM10011491_12240 [Brucella endophytica]
MDVQRHINSSPAGDEFTPAFTVSRRTLLAGLAAIASTGVTAQARAANDTSLEMILNDPQAPVGGNPLGNLTIVSFFDYNCPYCKRTVAPLDAVMKSDGQIRHVYKDWPILTEASVYGAKLALAAQYQGRYEMAHRALMDIPGGKVPQQKMRQASNSKSGCCPLSHSALFVDFGRWL